MKNYGLMMSISFETFVEEFDYWLDPGDYKFKDGCYTCTFRLKAKIKH